MHRLFVALRLPPIIIHACLDAMVDGPKGWGWQDREQLHLTLRYIGEVERPVAEDVAVALETLYAAPVAIRLSGVGHFDHGARSALFARVEPRDQLTALHEKIDRLLVRAGLPAEGRAYLPHITLARKRSAAVPPDHWLDRGSALRSDPAEVAHVTLFESHLGKHGATYEPVARYPLDRSAREPI